jgi:2Fe-2S ferredoxin
MNPLVSYPKNYIIFTVIHSGEEHRLQTYPGEYRDLRLLIADKFFLEDFGECGGMGRCATCMVEIDGLQGEAADKKRNESATLLKAGTKDSTVRLSCQIPVDDDLANTVIHVLENK